MKPIIVSGGDKNQEKRVNTKVPMGVYTQLRRIQDFIRLNNKESSPSLNDAIAFCVKYTYEKKIKPDAVDDSILVSEQ